MLVFSFVFMFSIHLLILYRLFINSPFNLFCRYLFLFLKFVASVIPTIEYDYTMDFDLGSSSSWYQVITLCSCRSKYILKWFKTTMFIVSFFSCMMLMNLYNLFRKLAELGSTSMSCSVSSTDSLHSNPLFHMYIIGCQQD